MYVISLGWKSQGLTPDEDTIACGHLRVGELIIIELSIIWTLWEWLNDLIEIHVAFAVGQWMYAYLLNDPFPGIAKDEANEESSCLRAKAMGVKIKK